MPDDESGPIGEPQVTLARRNMKVWLEAMGLPYHSPHKFRHGQVHHGNTLAKTIEDFKAVSMNVMHSSMKITDEFYSNLTDKEIQTRMGALGSANQSSSGDQQAMELFKEFLAWKQKRNSNK